MVKSSPGKSKPKVHLYKIRAAWYDAEGRENFDLWVRAVNKKSAFNFWKWYFETTGLGIDKKLDAENFFDDGFSIERVKTYADAPAVGAISWDEVQKILVASL